MSGNELAAGAAPGVPERNRLIAELQQDFSKRGIRRRRRTRLRRQLAARTLLRLVGLFKRTVDVSLAVFLLLLAFPAVVFLYLVARFYGGGIRQQTKLGRSATNFRQYIYDWGRMPAARPLHRSGLTFFPSLFNVIAGSMSFVGPRPIAPSEVSAEERSAWKRFDLKPGFICLWWIRKRANIAYVSESAMDAEYVDTHSVWGDLGIALRALPALLASSTDSVQPNRVRLLGIDVDNITLGEALESLVKSASSDQFSQVCFVNADCMNIAFRNQEYRNLLRRSSLVLPDGIGVRTASALLHQRIRQNVNGTDLLPFLCRSLEQRGLGLFLLGGRPGVAENMAARLRRSYPALPVSGYHHGYFTEQENQDVVDTIRKSGARVLLVAFGAPKQDLWIARHQQSFGVSLAIGVGGLFDFYSGRIRRAPVWVRELSLEWLYRFLQEPCRMWRRYFIGIPVFLARVLRERLMAESRRVNSAVPGANNGALHSQAAPGKPE